MKTNKKLAAILSAALAVSAPVVADDVMLIATNPAEEVDLISDVASVEEVSEWNTIMGEVTEVAEGMVVVKSEETEIALKASEGTIVIDQVTGFPSDISALEVGNIISAQYGAVMTRSIPAQTVADIIVVNADQGSLANLISADKVTANEDGTVTVLDETKQIELTISAEAEISPYKTRNIITLADIKEGDKLVAWYDMVTMSLPAQAYTEKVVVAAAPSLVEDVTEEVTEEAIEEQMPEWFTVMGEVTEVTEGMVVVKSEETEIALKASEGTIVIDQATGFPSDISVLEVGNIISAQYGPAMTMSLPAQTVADIIVVNADQGSLANLISADKVTANEDGTVTVLDETKQIELTISAEAEISPYKTRNIITLADIKEGDKLVAWYDMVTMSLPAQAYTEKVVVAAAPVLVEEVTSITVNGEAVEGEVVYSGDNLMVPVRSVAEALGFEVIWNDADFSVTLVKGDVSATVKIGEEGIISGKARSAEAFAAPELINDKTYVAENLFTKLLGEGTVETNNGVINFVAE